MAKAVPLQKKMESFVKEQISEARSAISAVETSAGRVVEVLQKRSESGRKEVVSLLRRVPEVVKALDSQQLKSYASGLKKRAEAVQGAILEATGVATREQLKGVVREVAKLSKKVDALLSARVGKA